MAARDMKAGSLKGKRVRPKKVVPPPAKPALVMRLGNLAHVSPYLHQDMVTQGY